MRNWLIMRIRKIGKALCLFAMIVSCLSAALLLGSCSKEKTLEERGYTVVITYDFNGGIVDETAKRVLYYKKDQPLLKPGDSNEFKAPLFDSRHTVAGWFRALTDENGEIKKDADGNILTEDTAFEFENARATESMTLVAKWKENPTITIMVDGREPDERAYEVGNSIDRYTYMEARSGYTFYDYYTDAECTQKAAWPIVLEDGDHITLYTKWLEGDVLIVRGRSDLSKLSQYRNKTVYLDADIDYKDSKTEFPSLADFSGKFLGNGHTIKNVTKKVTLNKNSKNYGIFGELKSGAVIENVTFENVSLDIKIAWSAVYPIGLISGKAESGVTISNCTFTDCSVIYTKLASASEASVVYGAGEDFEGIIGSADGSLEYTGVNGKADFTENK